MHTVRLFLVQFLAIATLFALHPDTHLETYAQVSYVYSPSEYNQPGEDNPDKLQVYKPSGANQIIAFHHSKVIGVDVILPTTLDFGPDGKLYVGQQLGLITGYSIERIDSVTYEVIDEEFIRLVKQEVDNHDDDGTPNSSVVDNPSPKHDPDLDNERQITGILATGTASNPVLYVTSSDPRHGAGVDGNNDSGLDTNSGVISRLSKENGVWQKLDLVRGLPRSEENHSINGLELDEANNILYVAVGGLTNAGSPSNNFARITEYALSAAILKIDLTAIDELPIQGSGNNAYVYDMPTLDDPTRPNVNGITDPSAPGYDGIDVNDPFGGNNGLNQSKIVPGGPVQLHATGFRNPYDLVIMESPGYAGNMYSIDNGANQGWGGHPVGEGSYPGATQGQCTNAYDPTEPGSTGDGPNDGQVNNLNGLHYIRSVDGNNRYYAGHPAPVRGNPSGSGLYTFFNGSGTYRTSTTGPNPLPADWPPIPESEAYAAECDFRNSGVNDGSLVDYEPSTNGMTEYTASNFEGEIQGAILSAGYNGEIFIAKLNAEGDQVTNGVEPLFSNFGANPLDVIAQGDDDIFPGTVWAVTYLDNSEQAISVFEPCQDGDPICACEGAPGTIDEDGDGFTNDDEIANATDPCNPSSVPTDNDDDDVSDLLDPDDDNDGIDDVNDPFAIDELNGIGTTPPLAYDFFSESPGTGFAGLGFTGWMTNGATNYLEQFDPNGIYGGTSGLVTVPKVSPGDAFEDQNNQENAFQFGLDVSSDSEPFEVLVSILAPFFSTKTPQNGQSHGFYIGSGDQDNYLKVVLAANNGNGGIEVLHEVAGSASSTIYGNNLSGDQQIPDDVLSTVVSLNLMLQVDPAAGTALPGYQVDTGLPVFLGSPISLSGDLLDALQNTNEALALGIISSAPHDSADFTATWDRVQVAPLDQNSIGTNPSTIDFHAAEVGGSSLDRSVTLTNKSAESITVNQVSFSGGDSDQFSHSFSSSVSIDPGATATMDLSFTPSSAGDKNATFEITYTGGSGSPALIDVAGEGVDVANELPVLYRVNAGGPAVAPLDDYRVWSEDQSSSNPIGQAQPGTPSPFVNVIDIGDNTFGVLDEVDSNDPMVAEVPNQVFKTERFDLNTEPNMQWSFEVPAGKTVEIHLYFAETFLVAGNDPTNGNEVAGPRIFDISIDGTVPTEFNDIDVFAEAGHDKAIVKSYVTESDGMIDIEFINEASSNNLPAIKAIQIVDMSVINSTDDPSIPPTFRLLGNYPNPFTAKTTVLFELPQSGSVSIDVFDVMGRKVLTHTEATLTSGTRSMSVDAASLSSGLYFYRITAVLGAQTMVETGRMTVVK